jgi:hypothetical protein
MVVSPKSLGTFFWHPSPPFDIHHPSTTPPKKSSLTPWCLAIILTPLTIACHKPIVFHCSPLLDGHPHHSLNFHYLFGMKNLSVHPCYVEINFATHNPIYSTTPLARQMCYIIYEMHPHSTPCMFNGYKQMLNIKEKLQIFS